MGRAFDGSGSYRALLIQLAALTTGAAALTLFLPRYGKARMYDEAGQENAASTAGV